MCISMCVQTASYHAVKNYDFEFIEAGGHAAIMQTHADEAMHDGGSQG